MTTSGPIVTVRVALAVRPPLSATVAVMVCVPGDSVVTLRGGPGPGDPLIVDRPPLSATVAVMVCVPGDSVVTLRVAPVPSDPLMLDVHAIDAPRLPSSASV